MSPIVFASLLTVVGTVTKAYDDEFSFCDVKTDDGKAMTFKGDYCKDKVGSKVKVTYEKFMEAQPEGPAVETLLISNVEVLAAGKTAAAAPAPAATPADPCANASTTPEIDACMAKDQKAENETFKADLTKIAKDLPRPAQPAFDKLQKTFWDFRDAEGKREYQVFIDGTIRNTAAMSQEDLVRDHFQADVKTVVTDKRLAAATAADYKAADAALNKAYKDVPHDKTAKTAQHAWIKYRDAWGEFAKALNGDATAAMTLITRDRIAELQNNPIGGG